MSTDRELDDGANVSDAGADAFSIVAIGASAGGLEACSELLDAMPPAPDMTLILVQHLDPTHDSMLVDLLSVHTSLVVLQATDGMLIERGHLYIIPPGATLSVASGALRLSRQANRHGSKLPFDVLLGGLARDYGRRVVCVVLSGTGTDGSLGLRAVKEHGGLVVAQDPDQAGFDGMPRSAILTGAVDIILRVADVPGALVRYQRRAALIREHDGSSGRTDDLAGIVELLRTRTPHDFTSYKRGTLQRRIERRMALATIDANDMGRYLHALRDDAGELDVLAKDLLINVTGFFRNGTVFDQMAATVVPDLVRGADPGGTLRVWIVGCSTGEEAYSIAMLFLEEISKDRRDIRLQAIASDVDPDAVAAAREGFYDDQATAAVSPTRLARFFAREDHGYRVASELRASVVFTVHNVLSDPPFSRLDLVSCRNLLIYLGPEAQARVASLFHFALRENGVLLLGAAENISGADERFVFVSEAERIYRHVARARPGDLGFSMSVGPAPLPPRSEPRPSAEPALAEICRRMVLDAYAPGAVLIDRDGLALFSIGPTDRYLRLPSGRPTHDLSAMLPRSLRPRLASAIKKASDERLQAVITGARPDLDGGASFSVVIRPVPNDDRGLLLVCFVDEPVRSVEGEKSAELGDEATFSTLRRDLDGTRTELRDAILELEAAGERQKTINDESLSINEEYQTANEELLTSKEELQSLNEELTALNSQLQETLTRQRTTSDDLQNVLYSTDVATLFLDGELRIRFFTPATKALFRVIATDIGRPLADLKSLADDDALLSDALVVLSTSQAAVEREIRGRDGSWFNRRVLPYRTKNDGVEGVVITFTDVTERHRTAAALEAAERQAQVANVAKSRFLAAASHDLRQPLQTLTLLQGMLANAVEGEHAASLVARLDRTLGAMSGMLNTLLDINQIEAGVVRAEPIDFPIHSLMCRLRDEFAFAAHEQGLELRVVHCDLTVRSDPRLLEQMIRNLLSNAVKYTRKGKILFGCRRRPGLLSVEVWDTGAGIPAQHLQTIFEEYSQLENPSREAGRGLGLGLSIVQRLAGLLDHRVHVHSRRGRGSVFGIDVALVATARSQPRDPVRPTADPKVPVARRQAAVLIVEDDEDVRALLESLLQAEGHRTMTAVDGETATDIVTGGEFRPELMLADYNLPGAMDGLDAVRKVRKQLRQEIPGVILTGDISTETLQAVALANCVHLDKPVKSAELVQSIQQLLMTPRPAQVDIPKASVATAAAGGGQQRQVFVVDDDGEVREALRDLLEADGAMVADYGDAEAFLASYQPDSDGCVLIDATLPGMSGLDLLVHLRAAGHPLPAIVITGQSDVAMAVAAMKAGASDFIEKPVSRAELLASIGRALDGARDAGHSSKRRFAAEKQLAGLTSRQREIMDLVLDGKPNKNIAADLGISQRTVENHRASIMHKTGSKSLPALARLALVARRAESENPHYESPDAAAAKAPGSWSDDPDQRLT